MIEGFVDVGARTIDTRRARVEVADATDERVIVWPAVQDLSLWTPWVACAHPDRGYDVAIGFHTATDAGPCVGCLAVLDAHLAAGRADLVDVVDVVRGSTTPVIQFRGGTGGGAAHTIGGPGYR